MKTCKKMMSLVIAIVLAVSLVACGGSKEASSSTPSGNAPSGGSAAAEPVTLLCSNAGAPEQAITVALEEMVVAVKERTNGAVIIDLQNNGALGSEEETIESGIMGTIDLVVTGSAALTGTVPAYSVCDLPFAFASAEEAYAFYDGEFGQVLFDEAAKVGLIGLAYGENGFRNMTNNVREIHSPADMVGLKMRTQSAQVYMDQMNALGASAIPIPYGELYSALQQGTVDGEENAIGNIYSAKFYEVQKYITLDRHTYDSNIIFLSEKCRDKLTDEQFEILKTAAYECAVKSREVNQANEADWLAKMQEEGLVVTELTAEQQAQFVEATKDVYKDYIDVVGQEIMDGYMKAIGR